MVGGVLVGHALPSESVNPEVESNNYGSGLVTCQVHNHTQRALSGLTNTAIVLVLR